jgi:LPPG:FO 2-phospho-L-lactate transferase
MNGPRIVALSGGVGGARLLDGLQRALLPVSGELTAIVNTGDDFSHWGLHISPDLDTVMYTLAGLAHEERGWGLTEESFATLEMVRRYGGEGWFALGDRDLATHLLRTSALQSGESLSAITLRLNRALGVQARVLPMADGPCRTMIDLIPGAAPLPATRSFQDWFVRLRAQPAVARVWFDGDPPPAPGVLEAIEQADLVVIGPSNPYVSIDPILSRPGVRAALARRKVVALSPIVGGQAVKGPLAAMIPQLGGRPASAAAVAAHYQQQQKGLLRGMVVERGDEAELTGMPTLATATVMRNREDRLRLAQELLRFAESLP